MARIFTDLVMHNYRSNQSAFMTIFGTDLRQQYGSFGGKSQTSFSRNATRAGSEEGRLYSQATLEITNRAIRLALLFRTSFGSFFPALKLFNQIIKRFNVDITFYSHCGQ